MDEQILTVEVDWTSKSGSTDSTIAFGETFTLHIKGMKTEALTQSDHLLRLMLLSQSVPDSEEVLWESEVKVDTIQADGAVEVRGCRIDTEPVLNILNQQGGKSRLYLAVTELEDGAPFADYGTSRLTVTLGTYIEDPEYNPPERVDLPSYSEIREGFNDVKSTAQTVADTKRQIDTIKTEIETSVTRAETAKSGAENAKKAVDDTIASFTPKYNEVVTKHEAVIEAAKDLDSAVEESESNAGLSNEAKNASQSFSLSSSESAKQAKLVANSVLEAAALAQSARDEAQTSASNASKSAEQASTSAQQAEDAKTAIGDVGGRLNAVETSVAEKAVKFSNYIKSLYDYQLRQINVAEMGYNNPCHDGWVFKLQYNTSTDYHVSATGKITPIPRFSPLTYGNYFNLCLMDLDNNVTQIFATNGSAKTLTTISGVGDDITITQKVVEAFPNAEIDGFNNIVGFASGNGFYACAGGHILDAELTKVGSFNCDVTFWNVFFGFAYGLRLLKSADKTFKYFDTSTLKQSTIVINDDGTPTITACPYSQDSKAQYLITTNQYSYFRVLSGNVLRLNENGAFYNAQNLPTFKFCGATRTGFVCNGKDLFYVNPMSNGSLNSAVQMTFGLVNSYENRNVFAQCVEDGKGNVAVLETVDTIYKENTQYVHIFKKKEA